MEDDLDDLTDVELAPGVAGAASGAHFPPPAPGPGLGPEQAAMVAAIKSALNPDFAHIRRDVENVSYKQTNMVLKAALTNFTVLGSPLRRTFPLRKVCH